MATNRASWLEKRYGELTVGPAPYVHPKSNQILIENRAVAINPLDWIIQIAGGITYRWLKYPVILGSDVSGQVVEVGSGVDDFKVGDRVIGHAVGSDRDANCAAEGGFQRYTAVLAKMACPIPDFIPYENAVVLPLGISTAACALYQKDYLHLELPSATPRATGETVLIWGGSSSVGSNAIQLAIASGYKVVTTASPRNFEYVLSLGASSVYNYRSPTVIEEIADALKDDILAGAVAIGDSGATSCVKILSRCSGNKFVAITTPPISFSYLAESPKSRVKKAEFIALLLGSNVNLWLSAKKKGVGIKYVFGTSLKNNEVSTAIYREYLPQALLEGRYLAAPPPKIVGEGLESIQGALAEAIGGVSAEKVVVKLP